MKKIIIGRKEKDDVNVEFNVELTNKTEIKESLSVVISNIESKKDEYFTKGDTIVIVKSGDKVSPYISSKPNGGSNDNIDSLPTYV